MAGHGWFGITVGRGHGGLGPGAFEYRIVAEEPTRAWTSVGSITARAQGAGTDVVDAGRLGSVGGLRVPVADHQVSVIP